MFAIAQVETPLQSCHSTQKQLTKNVPWAKENHMGNVVIIVQNEKKHVRMQLSNPSVVSTAGLKPKLLFWGHYYE